jgi:hypothetical protein
VGALPRTAPADSTLVTLPDYAAGHRVFVDGVPLADARSPVSMRCGRRTIKLGSKAKSRTLDLPCGRELVLR